MIFSYQFLSNDLRRVLHSGRDDDQHHTVTVILRKGMEKCLMEWKLINSRLLKIRMKGKHFNIAIIQCYTPTNDSEEESNDTFYDQLQAGLKSTPCHEMKIVMGDLNAKVGSDNTNHDGVRKRDRETGTRSTTWWSTGLGEDHCRMPESEEELM